MKNFILLTILAALVVCVVSNTFEEYEIEASGSGGGAYLCWPHTDCESCLSEDGCQWELSGKSCDGIGGPDDKYVIRGDSFECPTYCDRYNDRVVSIGDSGFMSSGGAEGKIVEPGLMCDWDFAVDEHVSIEITVIEEELSAAADSCGGEYDEINFCTTESGSGSGGDIVNCSGYCGYNMYPGFVWISSGDVDVVDFRYTSGGGTRGEGFKFSWKAEYNPVMLEPLCALWADCGNCTAQPFCGFCPSTSECHVVLHQSTEFAENWKFSCNDTLFLNGQCDLGGLVGADDTCRALSVEGCASDPSCGFCQELWYTEDRCRLLVSGKDDEFVFGICDKTLVEDSPSGFAYFANVQGFQPSMIAPFELTFSVEDSRGTDLPAELFVPPTLFFYSNGTVSSAEGEYVRRDSFEEVTYSYYLHGGNGNFSFQGNGYDGGEIARWVIDFVEEQQYSDLEIAYQGADVADSLASSPFFSKGIVSDDYRSVTFYAEAQLEFDFSVPFEDVFVSQVPFTYEVIYFDDLLDDPVSPRLVLYPLGSNVTSMLDANQMEFVQPESSPDAMRRTTDLVAMQDHSITLELPAVKPVPDVVLSYSNEVGKCSDVVIHSIVTDAGTNPEYFWEKVSGPDTVGLNSIFSPTGELNFMTSEPELSFSSEYLTSGEVYVFKVTVEGVAGEKTNATATISKEESALVSVTLPKESYVFDIAFPSVFVCDIVFPDCDGAVLVDSITYYWSVYSTSSSSSFEPINRTTTDIPAVFIDEGVFSRGEDYELRVSACTNDGCTSSVSMIVLPAPPAMSVFLEGGGVVNVRDGFAIIVCGLEEDLSHETVDSSSVTVFLSVEKLDFVPNFEDDPSTGLISWSPSTLDLSTSVSIECSVEYEGTNYSTSSYLTFFRDDSIPECDFSILHSTAPFDDDDGFFVECVVSGCDEGDVDIALRDDFSSSSLGESISLSSAPVSSRRYKCTFSSPTADAWRSVIRNWEYKPLENDAPTPLGENKISITPSVGGVALVTDFTVSWPQFEVSSSSSSSGIAIQYILSVKDKLMPDEYIPICTVVDGSSCKVKLPSGTHSMEVRATVGVRSFLIRSSDIVVVSETTIAVAEQFLLDDVKVKRNFYALFHTLFALDMDIYGLTDILFDVLDDEGAGGVDNPIAISALNLYMYLAVEQDARTEAESSEQPDEDERLKLFGIEDAMLGGRSANRAALGQRLVNFTARLTSNASNSRVSNMIRRPSRASPVRGFGSSRTLKLLASSLLNQISSTDNSSLSNATENLQRLMQQRINALRSTSRTKSTPNVQTPSGSIRSMQTPSLNGATMGSASGNSSFRVRFPGGSVLVMSPDDGSSSSSSKSLRATSSSSSGSVTVHQTRTSVNRLTRGGRPAVNAGGQRVGNATGSGNRISVTNSTSGSRIVLSIVHGSNATIQYTIGGTSQPPTQSNRNAYFLNSGSNTVSSFAVNATVVGKNATDVWVTKSGEIVLVDSNKATEVSKSDSSSDQVGIPGWGIALIVIGVVFALLPTIAIMSLGLLFVGLVLASAFGASTPVGIYGGDLASARDKRQGEDEEGEDEEGEDEEGEGYDYGDEEVKSQGYSSREMEEHDTSSSLTDGSATGTERTNDDDDDGVSLATDNDDGDGTAVSGSGTEEGGSVVSVGDISERGNNGNEALLAIQPAATAAGSAGGDVDEVESRHSNADGLGEAEIIQMTEIYQQPGADHEDENNDRATRSRTSSFSSVNSSYVPSVSSEGSGSGSEVVSE